jgi:glycosyltransferase involved in cell wall biosynthesis
MRFAFPKINGKANPARSNAFRDAGDRARNQADWSEAGRNYILHLQGRPDDFAIWVQLGNCLKEQGEHAQALEAYDKALLLNEKDFDVHLQKGHAYKLMGRPREAATSYRKSLTFREKNNPALHELVQMSDGEFGYLAADISEESGSSRRLILDIGDLVEYAKHNMSLSGIQRVARNLIMNASNFIEQYKTTTIELALPDYESHEIFLVNKTLVIGLLEAIEKRPPDRAQLDRLISAILADKKPIKLKFGDSFAIVGAFWLQRNYDLLNDLRRADVNVYVFIHDLIQIRNPEYVHETANREFSRAFIDILAVSSHILTNSYFVKNEVEKYIEQKLDYTVPVLPVPLATELGTASGTIQEIQEDLDHLVKDGFVLCVSTIEARKNHQYIVSIWERLIERFPNRIPNLVFVGKWGWKIEEFRENLAKSDYLGGRLFIYNAISDTALSMLYQKCLFTIYPSFAEGFGLPIGESLAYGKPCIASNTTSMPEVGGTFCKYFDPFDVDDGYRVISETLSDPGALDAWTQRVERDFKVRTWSKFSEELFLTLLAHKGDSVRRTAEGRSLIASGTIAYFGSDTLAEMDARGVKLRSARMSRISGWHGAEGWGCWAAKRNAVIQFRSDLKAGEECVLYLLLKTADGDCPADCNVKIGSTSTLLRNLGPTPRWRTVKGVVGAGGAVEVVFVSGKGFNHRHGREIYIGVIALGIAGTAQAAAHLDIIDEIVPGGLALTKIAPKHEQDIDPPESAKSYSDQNEMQHS